MEIKEIIQRGNIHTSQYHPERPGRYLANGRFGTVISPFGLNAKPERQNENPLEGRSLFCHMSHWGRFAFRSEATEGDTVADYLLPLVRVYWEEEPRQTTEYHQHQDFYSGIVDTNFCDARGRDVRVIAWTDMAEKDLACFQVRLSEGGSVICVDGVRSFIPYGFLYKQVTEQMVQTEQIGQEWCLTICCPDTRNRRDSRVYLRTNAQVEASDNGIRLHLPLGRTDIMLRYGSPVGEISTEDSLIRTKAVWDKIWKKSGWLSCPDNRMQQMWVRSIAYLLSSYSDSGYGIQPTSGLSGNMFPFHFVQDMGYIAPALQMMGHGDIVKSWMEYFAERIPQMQVYARHLWPESEGIYPPWELPFGDMKDYHRPCVPVIYCYEPHNVGYLCRMAAETAEYVQDDQWTQRIAVPLIRECARFYRSAAHRESDGFWHLKWNPCVGQDEAGGRNKSDYLCSLYSAKYCFETAVRFGLDEDGAYAGILKDGLCFSTLLSERGTLHTTRGADDFGKQKHPVQLDGITYMPTEVSPSQPERTAYRMRHDITDGAKIPRYEGWTLGQFLLAGTNLGDSEGWKKDWNQLREADYTDPEWVQFYETTGQTEKSFYMATHGLVLQSLIRNCVNDYWGRIQVNSCPVCGDGVAFGNIRTRLGKRVSGEIRDGHCKYTLHSMEYPGMRRKDT